MKYDVILADPPWTFSVWNAEKSDRHVSHKYDLMTTGQICRLPVDELAAENCALFLWITWPNLLDGLKVMEAWGFTYRTEAWVWIKSNPSGMGFFTGMGYYTRANSEACLIGFTGNTEPVLLGVKGQMPVGTHDIQALIYSPVREHSRKPDDQYRKIEALYPGKRYLELFARRKRPGWDAWGNEVDSDISLPMFGGGE